MIDTTLPQPGEHIPLPGQRSLLPDEPADTEARAALREWWLAHRSPAVLPRIESIRKLDLLREVGRDREWWQMVWAAAEEELGPLNDRRHDWRQSTESDLELGFGLAEEAITDEINLMLARLCGPEPTPAKESIMPAAVARKTKPAKADKPKPKAKPAAEVSSLSKPTLERVLARLPIDSLTKSPYQTRKPPTQERLIELGNLLTQEGQLTPCLVRRMADRGRYEIIGGHTRHAAAKMLGWDQIECRLVECDDETARRLVLIDNASHVGLTVIEHAQAIAELVDNYAAAGKSQRQLAVDIGVPQSEISNLVRMLALPEVWQGRVITEEITKTQARELLPWVDVPDLWPVMETARANDDGLTFDELLHESLLDVSRPMAGSWYDETRSRWSVVAFKATSDERKALNCRKVNGVERAFAWQLWESMQHVAEDKAATKAGKQVEATAGKVAAGKLDPQKAAEQHNKRLYRWKVAWLQAKIASQFDGAGHPQTAVLLLVWFATQGHANCGERRQELGEACGLKSRESWAGIDPEDSIEHLAKLVTPDFNKILRATLQRWVSHSSLGTTDMPPAFVEWLAGHMGIDIVRDWSLDRSYLELLTTAQLQELADEWKLGWAANQKRESLIGMLSERAKEKACPKAVKGIKAVGLH